MSKAIAPVASLFMDLMPKKIDKENIIYESFKVGDVKMHIMTPRSKADEITPCLFCIHGGGFIFKAYTNHYVMEQEYALGAGYRYLLANAEVLKIDTARMVIGGDSAGGLLDNKGTFHGYDINFKADITQESLRQRIRFLSESFPSIY